MSKEPCGVNGWKYGRYHWVIRAGSDIIVANADEVAVTDRGALVLTGKSGSEDTQQVRLALAPGHWDFIYAASALDGAAVAVDFWGPEEKEE